MSNEKIILENPIDLVPLLRWRYSLTGISELDMAAEEIVKLREELKAAINSRDVSRDLNDAFRDALGPGDPVHAVAKLTGDIKQLRFENDLLKKTNDQLSRSRSNYTHVDPDRLSAGFD